MRRHRGVLPLVLAGAVISCTGPMEPVGSGGVTVTPSAAALVVSNQRPAAIFFFVVERTTAASINWAPCADPAHCSNSVPPGSSRTIAGSQVLGWPGSGEVIVSWWQSQPDPAGGFKPDSIRSIVVRLPG